jgi:hypothetical protein
MLPHSSELTVKKASVCYKHLWEFQLRKWKKVSKNLKRGENQPQLRNGEHKSNNPYFQMEELQWMKFVSQQIRFKMYALVYEQCEESTKRIKYLLE